MQYTSNHKKEMSFKHKGDWIIDIQISSTPETDVTVQGKTTKTPEPEPGSLSVVTAKVDLLALMQTWYTGHTFTTNPDDNLTKLPFKITASNSAGHKEIELYIWTNTLLRHLNKQYKANKTAIPFPGLKDSKGRSGVLLLYDRQIYGPTRSKWTDLKYLAIVQEAKKGQEVTCGRYTNRATGDVTTVEVDLYPKFIRLFDRATGIFVKEKKFMPKKNCPKKTDSYYNPRRVEDDVIVAWLKRSARRL
ncbi:MAG: hypothetical protein AAFX99_13605 [Myxococcota bacterium]